MGAVARAHQPAGVHHDPHGLAPLGLIGPRDQPAATGRRRPADVAQLVPLLELAQALEVAPQAEGRAPDASPSRPAARESAPGSRARLRRYPDRSAPSAGAARSPTARRDRACCDSASRRRPSPRRRAREESRRTRGAPSPSPAPPPTARSAPPQQRAGQVRRPRRRIDTAPSLVTSRWTVWGTPSAGARRPRAAHGQLRRPRQAPQIDQPRREHQGVPGDHRDEQPAIDPQRQHEQHAEQQEAQRARRERPRGAPAGRAPRRHRGRHEEAGGHLGTGTLARTSAITWSEVMPSRSASARTIRRCRSTAGATRFTSSGSR